MVDPVKIFPPITFDHKISLLLVAVCTVGGPSNIGVLGSRSIKGKGAYT